MKVKRELELAFCEFIAASVHELHCLFVYCNHTWGQKKSYEYTLHRFQCPHCPYNTNWVPDLKYHSQGKVKC